MTHMRTQIRNAVRDALVGLPATADRVYVGRTRPLAANHLPTLLIYAREEATRREANGMPPDLHHELTLDIEARVAMADVPDDALDEIAAQVAPVMWANRTLGGLVADVRCTGTQYAIEANGSQQLGGIRITYSVTYDTQEGAPRASV